MVFIGASALWIKHDHFRVDYLIDKFSATKLGWILNFIIISIGLFFLIVMIWQGGSLTMSSSATTPILELPTSLGYASIPISGFIMFLYSTRDLCALFCGNKTDYEQAVHS
jgi:TRAP-type C4-dicarboxylate transport system permease small subunit